MSLQRHTTPFWGRGEKGIEVLPGISSGFIKPLETFLPCSRLPKEEDISLEKDLKSDKKEIAEHLMLLDLGRNDVGKVSVGGSVKVVDEMVIERYSKVMHIVSQVEGDLAPDKTAEDAILATFPAGTVSGAPKIQAIKTIDYLEEQRRGPYAGLVGYFEKDGSFDSCIIIRCAVYKNKKMWIQAGGGIVYDSDPELEFKETENKAAALMTALGIKKV